MCWVYRAGGTLETVPTGITTFSCNCELQSRYATMTSTSMRLPYLASIATSRTTPLADQRDSQLFGRLLLRPKTHRQSASNAVVGRPSVLLLAILATDSRLYVRSIFLRSQLVFTVNLPESPNQPVFLSVSVPSYVAVALPLWPGRRPRWGMASGLRRRSRHRAYHRPHVLPDAGNVRSSRNSSSTYE